MQRRHFVGALAATTAACAAARAAGAQTPATVNLRLAANASDDVTPLLWAQHTGMFTAAGLNVDIQKFSAGSAVTAAIVGGALDIGKSTILPLISARSHGIPLQIVAPGELWLSDRPISAMVVLNDSPVKTGKDLNGKTLPANGLHDLLEISSRAWVDANGGDARTLHFIEMPSSTSVQALGENRIAAATLSTPYLNNALASGKVRILCRPEDAIAKRFMVGAWLATTPFIEKNHDALVRFAEVVQKAAAYTNVHTSETVTMTSAFWGLEPDVLAHMNRAYVPLNVDPKDIQPLIDAALKYGVIEKPIDVQELISSVALRPR